METLKLLCCPTLVLVLITAIIIVWLLCIVAGLDRRISNDDNNE